MRFFDKQKIDDAGRTGVRLQKILLFFASVVVICGLFGLPLSLISMALSLGVLSFGFFGAYHRKTCLLKIYAGIRILELVFHFLVLVVTVVLFTAVLTVIALVAVGATTPTTVGTYVNDYIPISYSQPVPLPMPMPVETMPMQPAPEPHHSMPMQPAPTTTTTTTTSGMVMEVSNKMMTQIKMMMQPEPTVNGNYYGDVIVDYAHYVSYFYDVNVDDLTVSDIILFTALITGAVILGIVGSLVYYGLVIYTIVLSFRMARQVKQSAATNYLPAPVSEKVLPVNEVPPQPFIYVMTDNGSQPVLLQPVDPSLYPMQTFA